MSSVVCFEREGEVVCRSDREIEREQLEARIREHLEAKLMEAISRLTQEYEIEITVDLKTGKAKGVFKRRA
jgi:hypothetical protein